MRVLLGMLRWDTVIHDILKDCRLLIYPMVNPVGIYHRSRSNGNGVDLMRNAPVEAEDIPKFGMLAGHRISPKLPWYRGSAGAEMEIEAKTLCDFIEREAFNSPCTFSLDIHSGFGTVDRLWFPYAKSKAMFPDITVAAALKELLDTTYPNHVYCVEPQSLQYTTHGDLWDWLYLKHHAIKKNSLYIPYCLEMGSWLWVKKNPRQLFTALGAFNPVIPHRTQRTLRRHLLLFDFLVRAAKSYKNWTEIFKDRYDVLEQTAQTLWYDQTSPK